MKKNIDKLTDKELIEILQIGKYFKDYNPVINNRLDGLSISIYYYLNGKDGKSKTDFYCTVRSLVKQNGYLHYPPNHFYVNIDLSHLIGIYDIGEYGSGGRNIDLTL